jgi:hypothetical protein
MVFEGLTAVTTKSFKDILKIVVFKSEYSHYLYSFVLIPLLSKMSLELFRIIVAHGTIMKYFSMVLSVKCIGHNTVSYKLNKMQINLRL